MSQNRAVVAGPSPEEQRARGIAAMGRVRRDEDGFTVFAAGTAPDAFRVWDDPHVGVRCTCERFDRALVRGEDYRCEHMLAVDFAGEPPADDDEVPARDGRVRRAV